ncbi:hypothetical protein [Lysobacter antibioticus]|uniref:hypothetical protein n=1 Tax=Lysobacter antibioticus TaxID=84531 RepID=UPI0007165833|nr:hypothetical protein [Lysobacter antibioticus]
MNREQEVHVLKELLKAMDTSQCGRPWRYRWLWAGLWLATAAMFFVVFRSGAEFHWPHILLAAGCFGLGLVFAYDFCRSMLFRQWPVVAPHIDRERIERRLAELSR